MLLEIRNELFLLKEEKYQKFSSSLIPNVNNLIGVRIPTLDKIASKLIKENKLEYINYDVIYFEEIMIQSMMIAKLKDLNKVIVLTSNHLMKIDNWSLCDSFCLRLKIFKVNQKESFNYLLMYLNSNNTYELRFLIVNLLCHFINDDYIDQVLKVCDSISHPDYYVKMAISWCLQSCYGRYKDKTIDYLNDNNLDDFTFNKTISKICDSTKVNKVEKNMLRKYRRK